MATFTVIDHTELSSAAASWSATGIPQSYDHLLLCGSLRTANAAWTEIVLVKINGATTYYARRTLYQSASTTVAATLTYGATTLAAGYANSNGSTSNTFTPFTLWIPDYSDTSNSKQVLYSSAPDAWTTSNMGYRWLGSGMRYSTSSISSLELLSNSASNLVANSSITLYGITGA